MLTFKAVQTAVAGGRESVNLSTGPNLSKMRWSSKVVTHHDFDMVPNRPRSQLLHQAYVHVAIARDYYRERRRHQTGGDVARAPWRELRGRGSAVTSGVKDGEKAWN